jgi:hypothetical protein
VNDEPVSFEFRRLADSPAHPTYDNAGAGLGLREWGLTKRELFAAMAMQGLCATWDGHNYGLAERSVQLADALLAALKETP